MARSRNIKPGFFSNEYLGELDPMARLLFAGLWCIADREGRLEDRPKKIKIEVLPYDDSDVDKLLDDLMNADEHFIIRYEVEGNKYIQISNFKRHQNPHKNEKPSDIPPIPEQAPCKHGTSTIQEQVYNVSKPADSLNLIPDSFNLIPSSSITDSSENDADDANTPEIEKAIGTQAVAYTEQSWGRPLSPGEMDGLIKWCDDFATQGSKEPDAVVIEAIKRAVEQNVRKLAYVNSILQEWFDKGITSIEHITDLDAEWQAKKDKGKGPGPGDKPTTPPKPGKYEDFYIT